MRVRLECRAFTLIELLIVVAIIAILAAIAVPNFMEAQVRAKVSRAKADMRSLATALETYSVDYGHYPPDRDVHTINYCSPLTTPVAYMSSISMDDPFNPGWGELRQEWNTGDKSGSYLYCNYIDMWGNRYGRGWLRKGCVVSSFGPDRLINFIEHFPYLSNHPEDNSPIHGYTYHTCYDQLYDPTNGTKSSGDIGRFVGDLMVPPSVGG